MLKELVAEIIGMFVGDAWLTLSILAVVSGSAAMVELTSLDPLIGGAILLVGCPALLIENVRRAVRVKAKP